MMIYLLKGETVKQIMIKGWVCRVVSKYNEILVFECITGVFVVRWFGGK